jgi:peptidyl-prolyl cis-trans isomerase SurA
VLVLAGALSGCGVAGTGFHPGVAAEVGDDQIKVSRVDEIASNYCSAITEQLRGENQVLPLRYLRGGIAGQLALVAAAEQLAEEHGVEPGLQYDQKVAELEAAVAELPEGQQDAVIAIESSASYLSGVQQAVGAKLLREQGNAQPTIEESTQAGQQAFNEWLDEQDVSIDPQFGVELQDGQAVATDTSLSHAAGTTARNGNADTPDPAYAGSLPASLRCG